MLRRDSPKETVEEVVNQMLGTKAEVEEAYWIKKKQGESIVVAKLGNWEQKREVMTKKNKLKDKQLYIDNDLMVNDRQEIESEDLKNGMTERKMEVQEKVWRIITVYSKEMKETKKTIEEVVEGGSAERLII